MIHCSSCANLINTDPDGLILTCALTGHQCYIDDIPWTVMPDCPMRETEQEVTP